jgi:hypothetical protein
MQAAKQKIPRKAHVDSLALLLAVAQPEAAVFPAITGTIRGAGRR